MVYSVAVTVCFEKTIISVNENDGQVKPMLFLSKRPETDITIEVNDIPTCATST